MKNNLDLRVIKTKENIRASMLELLKSKTIYEITVKEICDGAKCSRNTFYLHYPYKEALYEEIIDECIEKVRMGFAPVSRKTHETEREYIDRLIRNIVSSMYSARDELNIIIASDRTNTFSTRLSNVVRETSITSSIEIRPGFQGDKTYSLIADFCSSGVVNYMLGCFREPSVSAAEAEKLLRDLFSVPLAVGIKYLDEHS